jgi:hypothetical protein
MTRGVGTILSALTMVVLAGITAGTTAGTTAGVGETTGMVVWAGTTAGIQVITT